MIRWKQISIQVRISILLPLKYNDGKDVEASKFLQTKEELVSRFGYCSALTPSAGTWIDSADGTRYDDINTGFYFDVEMDDELGTFLQYYKEVLMRRFEQKQNYITYHDINVI